MLSSIPSKVRRQGFTLIELLVVIAIIAILASILLPVFATARERARTSSCANNLKQISIAWLTYTQDYNETSPLMWNGSSNGTPPAGVAYMWPVALFSYVKSVGVYRCPDDSQTEACSYLGNDALGNQAPQNISAITSPADLILFMDGSLFPNGSAAANASVYNPATGSNMGLAGDYTVYNESTRLVYSGGSLPRHSGNTRMNLAFTDGHVKSSPQLDTANPAPTLKANIPYAKNMSYPGSGNYGQDWVP